MTQFESVYDGDEDEIWEDLKKTLQASKISTSAGVQMVATEFLKERQVIGSQNKQIGDATGTLGVSLGPLKRRASSTDNLSMTTKFQKEKQQSICLTQKHDDDGSWPLRMSFAPLRRRASSSDSLLVTSAKKHVGSSGNSGSVFDQLARRFSVTKVDDDIEEQYTLKRFEDDLEPTNPKVNTPASRGLSLAHLGLDRKTDNNSKKSGSSDIRGIVDTDIKYFSEGSGELLEEFGSRRGSLASLPTDSSTFKVAVKKRKTWTPATLSSALKQFNESDSSLDQNRSIDDLFPKRKDHHDLSDSFVDGLAVLAPNWGQQSIRQVLSNHDDSFGSTESM